MLAVCTSLLVPLSAVAQESLEATENTSSWGKPLKIFIPNVSTLTGPLPTTFLAKEFNYDQEKLRVTVKGRVEIEQGDYIVRADQIDYDQKTGKVQATGEVVILNPDGTVDFYDKREIKGKVKEGIINSFRNKLEDNKAFAAAEEKRFVTGKKKKVVLADARPNNKINPAINQTLGKLIEEVRINPASYSELAPSAGAEIIQESPAEALQPLPSEEKKVEEKKVEEKKVEEKKVEEKKVEEKKELPNPIIGNTPLIDLSEDLQLSVPAPPAAAILEEKPNQDVSQASPVVEPKTDAVVPNLFDALSNKDVIGTDSTVDLKKIITPVEPEQLQKEPALESIAEKKVEKTDLAEKVESKPEKKTENNEIKEKNEKKPKKKEVNKTAKNIEPKSRPKALALPVEMENQSSIDSGMDSEPAESMSSDSRAILDKVAPRAMKQVRSKSEPPLKMSHARDMQDLFKADDLPDASENTMGIKVEKKMPRINIDHELERAYDAINSGRSDVAIETYQRILDNDADNTQALFGLATLYHRARQLDLARPVYSRLLTVNPKHRDGFNNFLVMLADEAPNEALKELEKLETKNPGFSTIPAQIAVIYQKIGNYDKAIDKMFRAVALAPENLIYRYNLAIMLDKQKKYDEAARLYQQLLEAVARGEKIPGSVENIQQRLTFISSNR